MPVFTSVVSTDKIRIRVALQQVGYRVHLISRWSNLVLSSGNSRSAMLGKRVRESSVGSVVEFLVVAETLDGYIQAAQSFLVAKTFSVLAIAQTRSQ